MRVHSPRIAALLFDLDHQEFDVRLAALDQRQAPVAAEKQRCAVRFCTWLPACLFDPIRGFSSDTHLQCCRLSAACAPFVNEMAMQSLARRAVFVSQ
jgi:hypothetical protein